MNVVWKGNAMRRFSIAIVVTLIAISNAGPIVQAAGQSTAQPLAQPPELPLAQPVGVVLLKAKVVIDGPVVHLGDLFDGLGANGATPVARGPAPGAQVAVDARWLSAVARAYSVPWQPSSRFDGSVIERASIVIETPRIESTTIDALRQRGIDGKLSVVLDNPVTRIHLPTDAEPSLLVAGLTHNPKTGRFTAHIVAPAEGTPVVRITITGRAIEMIEIPVLRRRMMPGEVIREADIIWRDARADRIARNVVLDPVNMVGKSPRRPIRAEKPLLSSELRRPVLVPKNSLVTIRLQTARMVLTARGRAMEPGAEGDVIRVVNIKSNQIISASVTEPGTVEVIPGGLRAAE
jgi:flagella basal body P-ring formation protein FlgA